MNKIICFVVYCLLFPCAAVYSQDEMMLLRIMTYNIRHGAGMDDVIDLDRQAQVIQDATPDVVGLQEVDSVVKRSSYIHQAGYLGEVLGMHATFGGAIPLTRGKYGVAILSKEAPMSVHHLPLPGNEARTLLVCEFEEYVFATTHLDLDEECRLASLPIIIEEAASWDKPFFICGDWNDQPSSTFITKVKKSFVFLNNTTNSSANYTFPARNPTKIIDYIASYGRVIKSIRSRRVINEPEASDHRPVLVEVKMERYTTDISSPTADNASIAEEEIYDLSGKRVMGQLQKGIYIRRQGSAKADGKKLVIR